MPDGGQDRYFAPFPTVVEVNGREVMVTAHFAIVGGRMTCVGLDVRSFWSRTGFEPPDDKSLIQPVGDDWVEITSPLLRGIRTAEVINTAFKQGMSATADLLDWMASNLEQAGVRGNASPEDLDRVRARVDEAFPQGQEKRRRGRKPLLGDEMLRDVVAAAYVSAPQKPVQAVRAALAAAVPEYKGDVSPDVARKAVATARARGFIPPARGTRQLREGQP